MTIRVENKTAWGTRAMKHIMAAVLARNSKIEGRFDVVWFDNYKRVTGLSVTVVYGRGRNGYSGYAWLRTGAMRLRVPRPGPETTFDSAMFAALFEHELLHCRGYKHENMGSCDVSATHAATFADMASIKVEAQEPMDVPKPPPVDRVTHRRVLVEAALARWQKREDGAHRRVVKLKARLRGYEYRAAAGRSKP